MVKPDHIGDEAAWIVAVLLSARRQGVPVSFVEVANEPDGTWNTPLYTRTICDLGECSETAFHRKTTGGG